MNPFNSCRMSSKSPMAFEERHKKDFEIRYHFLMGTSQASKKAVIRELDSTLLTEIGGDIEANEIVLTVDRPGKTEIVEIDRIQLCVDTDITATEDNHRSIMIRATLMSLQPRNIVVVLNAALQDGVKCQILPCTEHHQLLKVSDVPQATKKIAIMKSVSQRIYGMFMMGFCSLTVKILLYRQSFPSSIEYPLKDDDDVIFIVEETPVQIPQSTLLKCSKFLSAYAHSTMSESQSHVFPIQDCSLSEFEELLSVSRGDTEINEENVDSMMELADRFIMPHILLKCELFLATCGYGAAELLYLADRYRMRLLAVFVTNQIQSEDELIGLMEFEGFELMSESMKDVVWKRFHDITECKG